MVAKENGRGRDALPLGNLHDGLGGHSGATSTAQRAIGHNMNAFFLTKIDNLLLGKIRVVLDLVNGGKDGGVRQKLLKVLLAVL